MQVSRDLREPDFSALLASFKQTEPALATFESWEHVLQFMHNDSANAPLKDLILATILHAQAEHRDGRCRVILLAMFWPGLERLLKRKKHWDDDEDERWQNIGSTFFAVTDRLNLDQRAERIAARIIHETGHRLYDHYRRAWRPHHNETLTITEDLDRIAVDESSDIAMVDHRDERQFALARLSAHAEAGHISALDFQIVIETRFGGRLLRECAAEMGLSVHTAKKRRQRAEAALAKLDSKKSQNSCPPRSARPAPSLLEASQ